MRGRGVSIGHDGDGGCSGFSDFSLRATKCQASTQPVRRVLVQTTGKAVINPPTAKPDSPENKAELEQTVDYSVQLLLEEAHTLGWQRVEFLTWMPRTTSCRRPRKGGGIEVDDQEGGGGEKKRLAAFVIVGNYF